MLHGYSLQTNATPNPLYEVILIQKITDIVYLPDGNNLKREVWKDLT